MDIGVLEEIILKVNKRTGISNIILEKDYYVCLILQELASKQQELQAYFKGGTAVYKILSHMNRFSEDIDLTVKVDKNTSYNSNKMRLKKAALGYRSKALKLINDDTLDKKGSITAFYQYFSLFSVNELFKAGKIQVEATSFTVSEPTDIFVIEPLIYKYANDTEKLILKEQFNIAYFPIVAIKLERIFVDKIFAAEFYYIRNTYEDFVKHIYDIAIMWRDARIINLLKNPNYLKKIIKFKREEEKSRIGGIPSNKSILDFEYWKLDFNEKILIVFKKMQDIYILDENSQLTIEQVKEVLKKLEERLNLLLS